MLDELVVTQFQPERKSTIGGQKIKVLLLSIHYPFAIKNYFEVALKKRLDIELRTVGPYTGFHTPWLGGIDLPARYAVSPDIPLLEQFIGHEIDYNMVKPLLRGWIPDIILDIDAGCHWVNRPSEGYIATVATDSHVLSYDVPRSYSDKFFNMHKFYSQPKDIPLPYCYSPEYHRPDETIEKDTDAVLIGMPYQTRVEWVRQLRERGVSVIFENGPIFEEARRLYNRGRIGLNWSSLQDMNARVFELMAMKLCPVMNRVPDLGEFFTDRLQYLGFSSLNEAVEQVLWAKEHPETAKTIAEDAYETVKPHTYDARVETILKECGFI